MEVDSVKGDWLDFYRNLAAVLRREAELAVKPEEAGEVVR